MKVKRKFRFYPTDEQKIKLAQTFGCVRFTYNAMLAWRKESYENGEKPTFSKSSSRLTNLKKEKNFSFLKDVSCVPLQQSLRHLQDAYVRFFRGQSKFPRFKTKSNRQSCAFTKSAFKYRDGALSLAKIGDLKVKWSMPLESEPTTVTAIREASGKYYVVLTLEEKDKTLPATKGAVGIDLGIKDFATFSDGRKFAQPEKIRRMRAVLAYKQRRLSRKTKGSRRREKARVKVAKVHEKLANTRKDFLDKLSTSVIRENQAVCVEDLAVSEMQKDRRLARLIGEQGWRQFREMLKYKAEWYGRDFIAIDRFEPTSKRCSVCGETTDLSLSQREWFCRCGASHDRDVNAARNILAAGQAVLARGGTLAETPKAA